MNAYYGSTHYAYCTVYSTDTLSITVCCPKVGGFVELRRCIFCRYYDASEGCRYDPWKDLLEL